VERRAVHFGLRIVSFLDIAAPQADTYEASVWIGCGADPGSSEGLSSFFSVEPNARPHPALSPRRGNSFGQFLENLFVEVVAVACSSFAEEIAR
jgi:hypothetical protein